MAGVTLIKTELRNDLVNYLKQASEGTNNRDWATDLLQDLTPKRIRKSKDRGPTVKEAFEGVDNFVDDHPEVLSRF